jgi:hypothetical protein
MVNEENSDLASVITDDSEPAVVSTLIQSVNVDLDTIRVLLLSSQLARMKTKSPVG